MIGYYNALCYKSSVSDVLRSRNILRVYRKEMARICAILMV